MLQQKKVLSLGKETQLQKNVPKVKRNVRTFFPFYSNNIQSDTSTIFLPQYGHLTFVSCVTKVIGMLQFLQFQVGIIYSSEIFSINFSIFISSNGFVMYSFMPNSFAVCMTSSFFEEVTMTIFAL